jgi:HEAT repeat protein
MPYAHTRNDLATFLEIDAFWSPDSPVSTLTAALDSDNWQVQQAALSAIGDRAETEALPAIEALLAAQDEMGVYACPDQWTFDGAEDVAEREMWRCRFRVKQAALIALTRCVEAAGAAILSESLAARAAAYVTSQADDYPVRVAAGELLGHVDTPASRASLEAASTDGEWCTAATARRSLARLGVPA